MKITIDGTTVYVTKTGLKAKTRDKVRPAGAFLALFEKGTARKIRKELRANGFPHHAAAKRAA